MSTELSDVLTKPTLLSFAFSTTEFLSVAWCPLETQVVTLPCEIRPLKLILVHVLIILYVGGFGTRMCTVFRRLARVDCD